MDNFSSRRRQLLFYFGFGITGAVAVTTFRVSSHKKDLSASSDGAPSSLASTSQDHSVVTASAPNQVMLPEFQGISQWLNSAPLTIAKLKGSVVLVQFWTFACINCQRTLPYIVHWHQQYASRGLKVIGIHTPEFAFERDVNNLKRVLQQQQITYPVPLDNNFKTWNAYHNEYWPHLFLADRQGVLRYDHIGEGAYDTTEQMIRKLLG